MGTGGGPLVVAIASGKGGVGKTMLAAAIAKELSRRRRTLLVDLDFFNRGLAGLLPPGEQLAALPKPSFLVSEASRGTSVYREHESDGTWTLVEVAPGLVAVEYGDISETEMAAMDRLGVERLTELLRSFVERAAALADCDSIVLDCHGGPDLASFAACGLADHALLVTEPDGVSLYGTRHFLRKLEASVPGTTAKLRLVFNRVGDQAWRRLGAAYTEQLSAHLGARPPLAAFPHEAYLADARGRPAGVGSGEACTRSPFCAEWFPNSLLAKKTEVLLRDLLHESHPDHLSAAAARMPRLVHAWRRRSTGRTVLPLRPLVAMLGVFLAALCIVATPLLEQRVASEERDVLRTHLVALETLCARALVPERTLQFTALENHRARHLALREVPVFADFPLYTFGSGSKDAVTARLAYFADHREGIRAALDPLARTAYDEEERRLSERSPLSAATVALIDRWKEHERTIVVAVGSWLAFAFLLAWTHWLDRGMTRSSRQRRPLATAGWAAVLGVIWAVPMVLVRQGLSDLSYDGERAVAVAFGLGVAGVWASQLWLAWRDARYHARRGEPALRVALACAVAAMALVSASPRQAPAIVRDLL
jgi:cellulose biosynthesis protein BcsQ